MHEQINKFEVGQVIEERYKIMRKLGVGGMGQVYEVLDQKLDSEKLALKIIAPTEAEKVDPKAIERFRSEVLISRKLTHQNIIRTYDFGVLSDGRLYMTMEIIEGTTLDSYIKKNKDKANNLPFAIFILRKIADALHYAQRAGVTHRDLKTQNILISSSGDVKIADFGLAQMKGLDKNLTVAGECVGTPYYMSPEQVEGKTATHLSDIYALGIIGYELLTAKVPFDDDTWYGLAKKIMNDPLPGFITKEDDLPIWYQEFVRKATAKNPADRFQSAGEIVKLFDENCFNQKAPKEKQVSDGMTANVNIRTRRLRQPQNQSNGNWFFTAILILAVVGFFAAGGYYGFERFRKKEGRVIVEVYNGPMRLAPAKNENNSFGDITGKKSEEKKEDNRSLEGLIDQAQGLIKKGQRKFIMNKQ